MSYICEAFFIIPVVDFLLHGSFFSVIVPIRFFVSTLHTHMFVVMTKRGKRQNSRLAKNIHQIRLNALYLPGKSQKPSKLKEIIFGLISLFLTHYLSLVELQCKFKNRLHSILLLFISKHIWKIFIFLFICWYEWLEAISEENCPKDPFGGKKKCNSWNNGNLMKLKKVPFLFYIAPYHYILSDKK